MRYVSRICRRFRRCSTKRSSPQENRVKFAPLPPKMFDIRGSKKWKMANYLLATEAARAGKLLTHPFGALQPDGLSAAWSPIRNSCYLWKTNRSDTRFLLTGQRILLAVGLILMRLRSSRPVDFEAGCSDDRAMGRLADGDVSADVPAQGGRMRLARWRTPFRSSKTI